jgi:hypothetical protein
MRALSATEAVSPAWRHTRNLFAARRWSTVLKVGLIAVGANLAGSGLNFNYRPGSFRHLPGMTPALLSALTGMVIGIALFSLVVGAVLFYLGSRIQFVFFEVVLRSDPAFLAPWRRYGQATWRWIGLKLLFLLFALLLLLPVLIPLGIAVYHMVKGGDFHPHFWPLLKLLLGFVLGLLAISLVTSAVYRLLYDFGLPSMALEGTPVSETLARVRRLVAAEPGPVLLYLVLYFLLSLGLGIGYMIAMVFVVLLSLIPLGGLGAAMWFGLRHSGILGSVFLGLGSGVLVLALVAVILAAILVFSAYIFTFRQAYALYFLGGRYPLLGSYLEPPPPPPLAPPAFVIPPAE